MRRQREVSSGSDGVDHSTHKILHLGRSHSEQIVSHSSRPKSNTRRSKSLGSLEELLSKTSSEFEEIQERDSRVMNETVTKKNNVSSQYKERWKQTRDKLFDAARSVLYDSLPVGRDTLEMTATAVAYSPVAVLAPPLRVLLYIWDALLIVQANAAWCLSLTERCVDILIIVENEILEAGADVSLDLKAPLAALTTAFEDVRDNLLKEAKRSFIRRYLRRRDTRDDLGGCDIALTNALNLFGLKIQIRSSRQLKEAERLLSEAEENRVRLEQIDRAHSEKMKLTFEKVLRKAGKGGTSDYTSSRAHSMLSEDAYSKSFGPSYQRDESSPYVVSKYDLSRESLVSAINPATDPLLDLDHLAQTSSTYPNYDAAALSPVAEHNPDENFPSEDARLADKRIANVSESSSNLTAHEGREEDHYNRMREILRRATSDETSDDRMADILAKLLAQPQDASINRILKELAAEGHDTSEAVVDSKGLGQSTSNRTRKVAKKEEEKKRIGVAGNDSDRDDENASETTPSFKSYPAQSPEGEQFFSDVPESAGSIHSAPGSDRSNRSYLSLPESAGSVETFRSAVDQQEGGNSDSEEEEFYDIEQTDILTRFEGTSHPPPHPSNNRKAPQALPVVQEIDRVLQRSHTAVV